jgi:hypothetical protein
MKSKGTAGKDNEQEVVEQKNWIGRNAKQSAEKRENGNSYWVWK